MRNPLTTSVAQLSVYLPQDHTLCQYWDVSVDRRTSERCLNHTLSNMNMNIAFGMFVIGVVFRADAWRSAAKYRINHSRDFPMTDQTSCDVTHDLFEPVNLPHLG